MKYELKIEYNNIQELENIIKLCYFTNIQGKLSNKDQFIVIDKSNENYDLFKGLNNIMVKVSNTEIIEGSLKFVVDEKEGENIKLFPCSVYCVIEDGKYSFY